MKPIKAVVMASATRNASRLNAYVLTEKDGQRPGERFVAASGINGCIPEFADAQMRDNRKRHRKDGTRTVQVQWGTDATTGAPLYRTVTEGAYVHAYHVIQSYAREGTGALDPEDPEAWEEAHRLGLKLAEELAGTERMAIVVTQIDGRTGCLHNHIVIDSVSKVTGKSFGSSGVKHKILSATHDRVLAEQGYEQGNERPSTALEHVEKSEERGLLAHLQWEANGREGVEPFSFAVLKERVAAAQSDPRFTTFEEYQEVAETHGVLVEQRGESGRGLTYTMLCSDGEGGYLDPAPSRRRRASKIGRFAMMDAVEESIERNVDLAAQKQVPTPLSTAQLAAAMQDDLDDELAELSAGSTAGLAAEMAAARAQRDAQVEAMRAEAQELEAKEPVELTPAERELELADSVILSEYDLVKWQVRSPSRGAMFKAGMSSKDVDDAIKAWRAHGEPRTAWERERDGEEARAADEPQAEIVVEDEQVTSATADVTPPAPATAGSVETSSTTPERQGTVDEAEQREPVADEVRAADAPPLVIEVEPEDEQVPSAAADGTPPALATASSVETTSVSPSQERPGTPKRWGIEDMRPARQREVATWEGMVQLNTTASALLADGKPLTKELTAGLRTRTLENHEEGMDPAVVHQLWRCMAKRAEATRTHEVHRKEDLAKAMRDQVNAGDFSWPGEPSTLALLKFEATRPLDAREELLVQQHAEEAKAVAEAEDRELEG